MRILFLDLDTLRPDHLGCYGYHRNTSPNIDRIAAEGTRFTNYFCSDAPCLPSRAALMTGRHGIHTGVVGHGGTTADMRIEGESETSEIECPLKISLRFFGGLAFGRFLSVLCGAARRLVVLCRLQRNVQSRQADGVC